MAKKQFRKITLDSTVAYLYNNGFIQSTIFHTVIFLFLLLNTLDTNIAKPVLISISFNGDSISEIDLEQQEIEEISQILVHSEMPVDETVEIAEPSNIEISSSIDNIIPVDFKSDISYIPVEQLTKKFTLSSAEVGGVKKTSDEDDTGRIIKAVADSFSSNSSNDSGGLGGSGDGDIEKRLVSYGAKTGDIQISIAWATVDDIDLHVTYTPGNGSVDNINWTNRFGRISSGILDIDMNANSGNLNNKPVENVFWPRNSSPQGFFTVYVHFYRSWTGNHKIPVFVRVKIKENIYSYNIQAILHASPIEVTRFKYFSDK